MAIDNKFPVRHWTWTTRAAAGQQTDHCDDDDGGCDCDGGDGDDCDDNGDDDGGDGDVEFKCIKMSNFLWYVAKPDYTMVGAI